MTTFRRLEGIMPALATPLDDEERVDAAGMRRLVRRVLDAGVHGVVVLGTAGELAPLAGREKRRAIEIVVTEVAGQVPVIAGTGEPGTRRALKMTRRAARLGADAAMVVPPYYSPLNADAVAAHYRILAEQAGLPIVLYNIPGCTKVTLEADLVAELAEVEGIAGIKDSSGNLGYLQTVVERCQTEQFRVVTGSDALLFATLAVGGSGAISPGTNVVPQWFVGLWDAVQAGRREEAWALQRQIMALSVIYRYGGFHAGLKAALAALGICRPTVAAPMQPLDAVNRSLVAGHLSEWDLI